MKKTNEEILQEKISVNSWNFLHHVLHSGEVYKQILKAMDAVVQQRDEEIKEWIENLKIARTNYQIETLNKVKQFLSTPSESQQSSIRSIIDMVDKLDEYLSQPSKDIHKEIEELRDDIEKCNETLDLVKDSDIIQMYGSIIGRLNLILNK